MKKIVLLIISFCLLQTNICLHSAANSVQSIEKLVASTLSPGAAQGKSLQQLILTLSKCCEHGDIQTIKSILTLCQKHEDLLAYLAVTSINGKNLKQIAIENKCYEIASIFIGLKNNFPEGLFMQAVVKGDIAQIDLFLKSGSSIYDTSNFDQENVLHVASARGNAKIVSMLLNSSKLGIDYQDLLGQTALFLAAGCGHEEVVNILLAHRANPNIADNNEVTPLHCAAVHNRLSIFQLLVTFGADLNKKDRNDMTPYDLILSIIKTCSKS